jgi:putative oxidoreductase
MKCSIFILRVAMAVVLLMHSLPGMFDGGVNAFGQLYLNQVGFAPVGLPLAWAIKLSHVICAALLLFNRFVIFACVTTIIILVAGIIMVHGKEGWFVVGGGTNGVEYNFVLICMLVAIMVSGKTHQLKA